MFLQQYEWFRWVDRLSETGIGAGGGAGEGERER